MTDLAFQDYDVLDSTPDPNAVLPEVTLLFLETLRPDGNLEFRYKNPKGFGLIKTDSFPTIARVINESLDAYFVVQEGGQTNETIERIYGFFIDVDAKDHPDNLDDNGALPLPEFHLDPTAIVRSGSGGYHTYWMFKEPVEVSKVPNYKEYQQALAVMYGGDLAVCDLARIMRLPGTVNSKNGNPVTLEMLNPENRYSVEEIIRGLEIAYQAPSATKTPKKALGLPRESQDSNPLGFHTIAGYEVPRMKWLDLTQLKEDMSDKELSLYGDRITKAETYLNRTLASCCMAQEGERDITLYTKTQHGFSVIKGLGLKPQIEQALIESYGSKVGEIALGLGQTRDEAERVIKQGFKSDVADEGTLLPNLNKTEDAKWVVSDLLKLDVWYNQMTYRYYVEDRVLEEPILVRLTQAISQVLRWDYRDEKTVHTALKELGLANARHPFKDYLNSLPKASGTAFQKVVEGYGLSEEAAKCLKWGFKQAVGGILGEEKMEVMLVLKGIKGSGKTYFLEQMFTMSPVLKPVVDSHFPKEDNKDDLVKAVRSAAYIVDECANALRSRNDDELKTFMSLKEFEVRLPYERVTTTLKRWFTIWGTANPVELLKDETGVRKFLPIEWGNKEVHRKGAKRPNIASLRDDFWAEMKEYWLEDPTNDAPDFIVEAMQEASKKFAAYPDGYEEVSYALRDLKRADEPDGFRMVHILQVLSMNPHTAGMKALSNQKLAKILQHMGWTKVSRKDGNYWFPSV